MGGYALGLAFDPKSGQMIMMVLLLMVGSFYLGTLFGNNAPPIYVGSSSNSSYSSSPTPDLELGFGGVCGCAIIDALYFYY